MEKHLFCIWNTITSTAFRLGMWLIRKSSYSLQRTTDSSGTYWNIHHWSKYTSKLDSVSRDEYAKTIREFLWFIAEPASGNAGCIPHTQHAILVELIAGRWCGGRTAAVVALIDEVMAEEDLVIF